ncbi:MAG: pantoate--beta-alanine ligase [Aestuariivirga sp.]
MKLKVVKNLPALRQVSENWRQTGHKIALVPTMGALHAGHLKLVEQGLQVADRVITTIFVNPKQFGKNEDLSHYPRDEEGDLRLLQSANVDLVFAPGPDVIYPAGFATNLHIEGPAKMGLEDRFRPHFFDGVATVVAKLLIAADADFAMFGEKDYQQLQVVKQLARDLDLPTEIISVATQREADGLAMSSRNRYLSKHERQQATAIFKSLSQAAVKIRSGSKPQSATRAAARSLTTLGFKVDYVAARNADTIAIPDRDGEPLRLLAAAWLGKTRLIDNLAV